MTDTTPETRREDAPERIWLARQDDLDEPFYWAGPGDPREFEYVLASRPSPGTREAGLPPDFVDALCRLTREALAFAYAAAGEGLIIDGAPDPEDVLYAYSEATGDTEWESFADRLPPLLRGLATPTGESDNGHI